MTKLKKGKDKNICGVCSGIAEYLDTDTTLIRLGFIAALLFSCGYATLFYFIAALVMPNS
jgi:phage shock protein PspC (stress-responsive transcriptional regulator)